VGRRFAAPLPEPVVPRHAYFVSLTDGEGARVDQGLFLYFRAPHSFTGEDVVELQTHGSPALLSLLQTQLLRDERLRLAEPGEFSRRAFLNGRIDLAHAEAVAELVAARNDAAVRAAGAQLAGAFVKRVEPIRQRLLELQADLEGELNFPDEAEDASAGHPRRIEELQLELLDLAASAGRGRLIRDGAQIVLYGPVNAGKSTLFNVLVGEDRALVDEEPGTTRDVLQARIEFEGIPAILVDTAGLRSQPARVEALGIARAEEAVRSADLAVLVCPGDVPDESVDRWLKLGQGRKTFLVRSKSDISRAPQHLGLPVSARTGEGLPQLRRALRDIIWDDGVPSAVHLISIRQEAALQRGLMAMARARSAAHQSTLEVVAGEVGLTVEALSEITGDNGSEELLDEIFRRFCIGK
jgi:tRNA modification GTPase